MTGASPTIRCMEKLAAGSGRSCQVACRGPRGRRSEGVGGDTLLTRQMSPFNNRESNFAGQRLASFTKALTLAMSNMTIPDGTWLKKSSITVVAYNTDELEQISKMRAREDALYNTYFGLWTMIA
jgi:hypothetical protein